MKLRGLLLLGGLFLVAITMGVVCVRQGGPTGTVRKPIDFTLQDLNGKPVTLSSYRGKVVLIDMWATWCGYCVGEIPELIAVQGKADKEKTPLQILGIAMDINPADVRKYAAKHHFDYPILLKDDTQLKPFGEVAGLPTKFIIDKNGVIVDMIVGAVPIQQVLQRVAKYMK